LTTFISLRVNAGVEKVKWDHGTWFVGQPVRRSITLCLSKMISAVLDV